MSRKLVDSKKAFGFQEQLKVGSEGESLFLKLFDKFYVANNEKNCRLPDFIHRKTGALVEVKYDDSTRAILDRNGYQMNFFIEKFSNDEYQTLGGPFRAVSEGCDYYVYIFKKPCRIFILDAKKLLEKVNRLIETNHFPKKLIPNRNYKTSGYALPISALMSCIVSEDKFKSGVKNNH